MFSNVVGHCPIYGRPEQNKKTEEGRIHPVCLLELGHLISSSFDYGFRFTPLTPLALKPMD